MGLIQRLEGYWTKPLKTLNPELSPDSKAYSPVLTIEKTPKPVPPRKDAPLDIEDTYSDKYTYEEWLSFFDKLVDIGEIKLKVKSSPEDEFKRVYAIEITEKDTSGYDSWINRISFSVTASSVQVSVMSGKNKMLSKVIECLFDSELEMMPLFIGNEYKVVKEIAIWRLENGV